MTPVVNAATAINRADLKLGLSPRASQGLMRAAKDSRAVDVAAFERVVAARRD